jgi:hypothetical protein
MSSLICRRGDTWKLEATFALAAGTIAGAKLWFTIKKRDTDPDPGLLQLASDGVAPGIVIADATHATVTISAAQSSLLPVGPWWFDLQIKLPNGDVYTTDSGTFQVLADITRSTT